MASSDFRLGLRDVFLIVGLSAMTSVAMCAAFIVYVEPRLVTQVPYIPEPWMRRPAPTAEDRVLQVAATAQPAVVSILVSVDGLRHASSSHIGGGSGFFVSADGMLVTNRHVIDASSYGEHEVKYQVVTSDGKKYTAKLLASDPMVDIAFLKVDGHTFSFLTLAERAQVQSGQTVLAIGNALDEFQNTVTKGIISGTNRRVVTTDEVANEVIEEAIQTDAAINPGNSGGPLLALDGLVIGVNTALAENGQSLGFAIPAVRVAADLRMLQTTGKLTRPFIGIRYVLIDEEMALSQGLAATSGVMVIGSGVERGVMVGSPAAKAGLKEKDIITAIDGMIVDERHALASSIAEYAVGDTVTLRILREGKYLLVPVTLTEYTKTSF